MEKLSVTAVKKSRQVEFATKNMLGLLLRQVSGCPPPPPLPPDQIDLGDCGRTFGLGATTSPLSSCTLLISHNGLLVSQNLVFVQIREVSEPFDGAL